MATPPIDQNIFDALTLSKPKSANSLRFSTVFPLEFDFSEILRRNLSERKIKSGALPKNGWSDLKAVPGKMGKENRGAGILCADISGKGNNDLLILVFDAESKRAFYRIGWSCSPEGDAAGWSRRIPVPLDFGDGARGLGCALGDLSGTGRKDLVIFYLENEEGQSRGRYVIGKGLSPEGIIQDKDWTEPLTVPGWFGDNVLGADISLADISKTGRMDLVVFHLNKNDKRTTGHYRIGWELDANGRATGDWTDILDVPGEYADDIQGAGLAVGDIKRTGKIDFLFSVIENGPKANTPTYCIGWDVNAAGNVSYWSGVKKMDAWAGWESQGMGIAFAPISQDSFNDLIVFQLDNPSGSNRGYYQIGWNMDSSGAIRFLGDRETPGKPTTRLPSFDDMWVAVNPSTFSSDWQYIDDRLTHQIEAGDGPRNAVVVSAKMESYVGSSSGIIQYYLNPSVEDVRGEGAKLLYKNPLALDVRQVRMKSLLPTRSSSSETGVVFNWQSENDYWVLCYRTIATVYADSYLVKLTTTGSGGMQNREEFLNLAGFNARASYASLPRPELFINKVALLHYSNGQCRIMTETQAPSWEGQECVFSIQADGSAIKCAVSAGGASPVTFDYVIAMRGQIGVFARYAKPVFLELKTTNAKGEDSSLLPLDREIIPSVKQEFQRGVFTVKMLDNRPARWIESLQRLVLEKEEFAQLRYRKAKDNYEQLFSGSLASTVQEIETAERLFRQAFDKKLEVEKELEGFLSFLTSQGLPIGSNIPDLLRVLGEIVKSNAHAMTDHLTQASEANCEVDIRRYTYGDGQYTDQYGVTLHDHVLEVTEHYDYEKENILIIPIVDLGDPSPEPSRVLIVTNPVFSGTRIHPPAFFFEEKYRLGLEWTGIGLGEFSHSVNLFPGEEREMEITATKKRTWESVSKSSQSSTEGRTAENGRQSKRTDDFESKLSTSMEASSQFSSNSESESSFGIGATASANYGFGSASINAQYNSRSKNAQSSSLSSTAKKAADVASKAGSEVSDNNKVSFASSTEQSQSLEERRGGEDTQSDKTKINIRNLNEGKTINYNFYQVTNNYATELSVEDVRVHLSTGVEIIPRTGITVARSYDIEDVKNIIHEFRLFSLEDRKEILKALGAQIAKRYMNLGVRNGDLPRIVSMEKLNKRTLARIQRLSEKIIFDETFFDPKTRPLEGAFRQPFPEELLTLFEGNLRVTPLVLSEKNEYSINSGKFFVDAHIGVLPATETYLENRRTIESDRQQALVDHLKARTKAGVFFQELPAGVTTLALDGETLPESK